MDELNAGARQAALLVHALGANDADWLLAQLAPERRRQVSALVAELRQLGIPAQRPLIVPLAPADAPPPTSPLGQLAAATPEALAELLRAEPAGLAARLLCLAEWPWRAALLEQLGVPKRREVEAALAAAPGCPPALGEALLAALLPALAALAARQPALPAPPASPARRTWLRRAGDGQRELS